MRIYFTGFAILALSAWIVHTGTPSGPLPAGVPATSGERFSPRDELLSRSGRVADGAFRAAIEQKAATTKFKTQIRGADGQWQEYGRGTLITNGLIPPLNTAPRPLNIRSYYSGRVDNFAYDASAKRLFAAVGTGGIWMSEAVNGDVRTLADQWVDVGLKLPSLSNGGVVWTPAGGGTLIAAGGESVMGNNGYMGLGAYWTTDLGNTWTQSRGFPDGAQVYNAKADPGVPRIVYIASSKGLFRSDDAGRSFVNVRLPTTPECAGVEDISSPCQFTNFVTDVVVQMPGGVTNFECRPTGCPVLAAVGWRAGQKPFTNSGLPQAPANGLYRSDTGEPGEANWTKLELPVASLQNPAGFAARERTGRIELGNAVGRDQDHGYVYALVQDSVNFIEGYQILDALPPLLATAINGAYVSADFGKSWTQMANDDEIALTPGSLGLLPGGQAWYNEWIQPDPTRQIPVLGIPTRLTFGLEEIFQNRFTHLPLNGLAQTGPQDFEVIGRYFSATGLDATTHPDQHVGLYIPYGDLALGIPEGVCLFAGNDGGVFKQCVPTGTEMSNAGWGQGANTGFYTLLPYGLAVAKDGTVWFGLQDNGSGHIEPDSREMFMDFGADGFFAEVNPDNSNVAYTESQNGGLVRTTDRGASSTGIAPPYTRVNFANWFSMDPLDAQHMVTAANQIYETRNAETVTSSTWDLVYVLGEDPDTGAVRTTTVMDVHGDTIYAGFCGDCGHLNDVHVFKNGIATNVSGEWHEPRAKGLGNRFIAGIEIDPANPKTVYVTLAGYMANIRPAGSHEDSNPNIGTGNVYKSTDGGENFKDISGNLPQAQVNSVVLRDGQLLVGTDIGAFISSDTEGKSWAPLGNGLPNVAVSMLRLQPGNPNQLFASTFGRGFWTYEFAGEAAIKSAAAPAKQGKGLFLGALHPWMLWAMLLMGLSRFRLYAPRRFC